MTFKNPPKRVKRGTIVRAKESGITFNGNTITKGFLYILRQNEVLDLYSICDDNGQPDVRHKDDFEIVLEL